MRKTLLVVVLGVGAAFDLSAQELTVPDPRVRVSISRQVELAPAPASDTAPNARLRTLLAGGRLTGTLLDQDSEALTLWLDDGSGPLRIPLDAIGKLQVSRGHSRKKSTLIGAAVGLAGGVALAVALEPTRQYVHASDSVPVAIAGVCAAAGALVGLALPPQERWQRVEPGSQKLKVGLVPRRGGVGVSVALAF